MKMIMNTHVDHERRVMFGESVEATQKRLEALVKQVEAMMSERVMEIFVAMRRDNRSVLGGAEETQGELLPKAQRLMRKEIKGILEGIERMFTDVLDGKVGESSDFGEEDVKNETEEFHSTMDEFGDSSISDEAFNSWMDEGTSLNKTNPEAHVPMSGEEIGLAEPSAASSASNSHSPRATSNVMGTLSPRVGPFSMPRNSSSPERQLKRPQLGSLLRNRGRKRVSAFVAFPGQYSSIRQLSVPQRIAEIECERRIFILATHFFRKTCQNLALRESAAEVGTVYL